MGFFIPDIRQGQLQQKYDVNYIFVRSCSNHFGMAQKKNQKYYTYLEKTSFW